MKHSFDYSPLNQTIAYKDAVRELPRVDKQYKLVFFVFAIVILIVGFLAGKEAVDKGQSLLTLALGLTLIALTPALYYLYHRRNVSRAAKLQRFAKQNKLTLISAEEPHNKLGMLFETGRNRLVVSAIRSDDNEEIGTLRYVTGYGRASRSHHYTYMTVPLGATLPNIVLDSKKNNTFKNSFFSAFASNAPEYIKKDQKIAVSNEFDDVFKTYVSDGGEASARSLLDADTQQALLRYIAEWDVEVVGDRLVIFAPGQVDLTAPDVLRSFFEKLSAVHARLTKHTAELDDGAASLNVHPHESSEQRLRRSAGWIGAILLTLLVINLVLTIASSRLTN